MIRSDATVYEIKIFNGFNASLDAVAKIHAELGSFSLELIVKAGVLLESVSHEIIVSTEVGKFVGHNLSGEGGTRSASGFR